MIPLRQGGGGVAPRALLPGERHGVTAGGAGSDGQCKLSERSREPMPQIDVGGKVV